MEPKVVQTEAVTVLGLRYRGRNQQNEVFQLWQALHQRMGEIGHLVDDRVAYGISDNMDQATGEFDYVAGYPVTREGEAPEGMVLWEVPGGTYAVFTCTLPTIGQVFDYAYKTWIPQSDYGCAGGADVERYDERFDPAEPSSEFELYIPIQAH